MARRGLVAAAALVAALASVVVARAEAQTYATLHVRSFTMSADRASVAIGEPFHLTIATHVDERVVELDNLTLPDLSGFDSLGDERRCVASSSGSDCVETVTLSATIAGTRTIDGATLDAIDARNGKPSRFTSDVVRIAVTGPVPMQADSVSETFFGILRAGAIFLLVAIAFSAVVYVFASRRKKPIPSIVEPRDFPTVIDPRARLRALARELEREPSRANVLVLRRAMREDLKARDEETFADLTARGAGSADERTALGAVERAAFCEDDRVVEAVREALPFLIR